MSRKTAAALVLLTALALLPARRPAAQDEPPMPQPNPDSERAPNQPPDAPPSGAPSPEESPEPLPAANAEMSPEDAGDNFQTVVSSFIDARSPKGYWPLKDKATGEIMKLKLVKVNTSNLRKLKGNVYAGSAVLKDIAHAATLKVEFSVDFSGAEWKVTGMRVLTKSPPPAKRKPAAKKA